MNGAPSFSRLKTQILTALLFSMLTSAAAWAEDPPVLYIGDSISVGEETEQQREGFGPEMNRLLTKQGYNVYSKASCGSLPSAWMKNGKCGSKDSYSTKCGYWEKNGYNVITRNKPFSYLTPQMSDSLHAIHPKVTIIQLGTNIAVAKNPPGARDDVISMMDEIYNNGSKCVWIGPPNSTSPKVVPYLNAVRHMIQEVAKTHHCNYVSDLDKLPFNFGGDGIHPPSMSSSKWARNIFSSVMEEVSK